MKRPLFCVAMAYALGEVICLYTNTLAKRSIAIVVLLLSAIFYMIKEKKIGCALGILLAVFAGAMRAFFCVPEDIKSYVIYENGFWLCEEEHYDVFVYKGTCANDENSKEKQEIFGFVIGQQGDNLVLQVQTCTWKELKSDACVLVYLAEDDIKKFQSGVEVFVRG